MPDWVIQLLKLNFIKYVINKLSTKELKEIGVDETKRSHIRNPKSRNIPSLNTLTKLKDLYPDFDMNTIFEPSEPKEL